MNNKLLITEDGSHTVLNSSIEETYHSENGAISESQHVFIENGLSLIDKNETNILEIGFGTGLNALLSLQFATEHKKKINYFTLEKYPLGLEFVNKLNYPEQLNVDREVFKNLHTSRWNKVLKVNEYFIFLKLQANLLSVDFNKINNIDLVYFDAFSPSKQPEFWTENVFKQIYLAMSPNGLLSTYSSAGMVKRALRNVGFDVKRKPGPKGKFHMLNATKKE